MSKKKKLKKIIEAYTIKATNQQKDFDGHRTNVYNEVILDLIKIVS